LFLLGAWNTARHLGATLNWRRDPGYEQRMNENRIAIERSKERIKQIESEILQVRNDSERIEKDTEQIKKETEQLRQENVKEKALSASIKRLCFPPESSSIHQTPIEPGSKPFLPS
jgi:predicted RNase H-like nuclease (RuvC/YqgF family)